jgi:hypothetical protein
MVLVAPGPPQRAQVAEDRGRCLEHEHRHERTPRVGVLDALPPGCQCGVVYDVEAETKATGFGFGSGLDMHWHI